ncbi:DUF3574 domain-containing protein [Vitreimonas flagellata]|uniref:DUF3574 domain-containing protein n=1 Tax=Vitreimonas flagellata TaxID=2560861 RepID=UPI001431DEC3|nr:DUF3574 domain-containing protein [Vitreimonas flagellata]
MVRWFTALSLLALAACAQPAPAPSAEACAAPAEDHAVAEMYFGRNIGETLGVTDEEWRAFVDGEISPRFPNGLTIDDVDGQWRDTETGAIVREPSKRLTLVLTDAARDQAALEAIAAAYRTQHEQQSVMLVVEHSCVAFLSE